MLPLFSTTNAINIFDSHTADESARNATILARLAQCHNSNNGNAADPFLIDNVRKLAFAIEELVREFGTNADVLSPLLADEKYHGNDARAMLDVLA